MIGADGAELGCERGRDLDVLAHDPFEHLPRLGHDVVQVESPRLQDLLATVGKQLAGQARSAIGRLADLCDLLALIRVAARPAKQDLGVAADHGQEVVEVVRDAAGELSDPLHLLRLPQLILERLSLRLSGASAD